MIQKVLFTFLLTLIGFTHLQAQNTSSRRARKAYGEARLLQANRKWDKAIQVYRQALLSDPKFGDALFALADLLERNFEPEEAMEHYQKLVELYPEERRYSVAHQKMAAQVFAQGKYKEAMKLSQKFLAFDPSTKYRGEISQAKKIVQNSQYALKFMSGPKPFNPEPLNEEFNAFSEQYFPVLTADQQRMIFTARKFRTDENIYESEFVNGKWTEPAPIKELNTRTNEGTCSISADGKMMVYTACNNFGNLQSYGGCDLYVSYKEGGKWSEPKNMGRAINSRDWESQPALSADGRKLFFASERRGGKGRRDIWMSEKGENGKWKAAVNLGDSVNTAYDETSPFLHVNGKTLFLASDRVPGFGGSDVYQAEFVAGKWQSPENLGYPINNHKDQVGFFVTADAKKAYYSDEVVRKDGTRISQIKVSDIPGAVKIQALSGFVKGKVFDAKTEKPLAANIELKDLSTNEMVSAVHSDPANGEYLIVLNEGAEYALHATAKNYVFKSLTFDYQQTPTELGVEVNIPLEPLKKGTSVQLNNIFFSFDSDSLQSKSIPELETVRWFMERHPEVSIEIGGYTDNQGKASYNQNLSFNRAQAVKRFLVEKGIEPKRVSAKGYGQENPIASNETEEGRARNRRIEFKIL